MIAILMATYNGEEYIREQLDSILNQSCSDFKIYIHDDGSTDKTPEIAADYAGRFPEKVEVLDGPPTGGGKYNFFYLLKNVKADYYMFSDQDDVWLKNKVELSINRMHKMEKLRGNVPLLAYTNMKVVDSDLNVIDESHMHHANIDPHRNRLCQLIPENVAYGCTIIFNDKLKQEMFKVQDVDILRWHDWWASIVAASTGYVSYIDECTSLYRQHGDNSVGSHTEVGLRRKLDLFKKLITLSHIGETKIRISHFMLQAQQLQYVNYKPVYKDMIEDICNYYSYGKLKRVNVLIKYRMHRNKRKIWQVLCA